MKVYLLANGNMAVFDNGQQVPRLQHPWLLLVAEYLARNGVDPTAVEIQLPDRQVQIVETAGEGAGGPAYNWRFKEA